MKSEIINGNCFEIASEIIAQKKQEGKRVAIVTDPPFNVGYHYAGYSDKMPEREYYESLARLFANVPSVVIHYPEALHRLSIAMGNAPEKVVAWCYHANTPRQHRDIAYYGITPDFSRLGEYRNANDKRIQKLIADGRKPRGYDWQCCEQVKNVSKDKTKHPCQMPIQIMDYVVATIRNSVDVVIEPFAGSGTTLVACRNAGTECIGIEQSAEYCEIIRGRLNTLL